MNTRPATPRSTSVSGQDPGKGFRCAECGRPLVWCGRPAVLPSVEQDEVWETPPQIPSGEQGTAASGGWVCVGAECRRVYAVWDGIPNFLRQEAGVLTAAVHAGLPEAQSRD